MTVALTFDDLKDSATLGWEQYVARHPYVLSEIVRIARQAKDRGETRISMKLCFELARKSAPRDGQAVALNNNWTAPATRQVVADYPELAEMFRTRRRHV